MAGDSVSSESRVLVRICCTSSVVSFVGSFDIVHDDWASGVSLA